MRLVASLAYFLAQDAAYGRLQAMRRDKRARSGPFLENRRFSAQVRDLIRDGHADDARAKCEKQARSRPQTLSACCVNPATAYVQQQHACVAYHPLGCSWSSCKGPTQKALQAGDDFCK